MIGWGWEESSCATCEEPMAFRAGRIDVARKSGAALMCPFGHKNYWNLGKSKAEKLQEQLDEERRQRQRAEQRVAQAQDEAEHQRRRANGYKGHATRITKRAKAGVCPCCNRSFENLRRHMDTKHPTFTPMPLEVIEGGKAA